MPLSCLTLKEDAEEILVNRELILEKLQESSMDEFIKDVVYHEDMFSMVSIMYQECEYCPGDEDTCWLYKDEIREIKDILSDRMEQYEKHVEDKAINSWESLALLLLC
jgi:enamine deaminase RidA (YjgF/YER057c/UK114 family)